MAKRDPRLPPGRKAAPILHFLLEKVRPMDLDHRQLIFETWNQMVGPKIAPLAKPIEFSNGFLKVEVASSALLNLLAVHEKPRLIRELCRRIPSCNIQNILFRLG